MSIFILKFVHEPERRPRLSWEKFIKYWDWV